MRSQTRCKTLLGHGTQRGAFIGVAGRETWQNRLACSWAISAAQGNLNRIRRRFRKIGKEFLHRRARFERVVRRHLAPVRISDEPSFGNCQQRIMRRMILWVSKIDGVRTDDGNILVVSEVEQRAFDTTFFIKLMPLQFDIKSIAERFAQRYEPVTRKITLSIAQSPVDQSIRPAR